MYLLVSMKTTLTKSKTCFSNTSSRFSKNWDPGIQDPGYFFKKVQTFVKSEFSKGSFFYFMLHISQIFYTFLFVFACFLSFFQIYENIQACHIFHMNKQYLSELNCKAFSDNSATIDGLKTLMPRSQQTEKESQFYLPYDIMMCSGQT